jgi:putative addiction module killer protein
MKPKQLIVYQAENGKLPFEDWLDDLDKVTRVRILARLDRVKQGNYGDYKSLGEGVLELRYFFGSGYRVYFAEEGDTVVLLLCGGDKSSQAKDVAKAQEYWNSYKLAKVKAAEEAEKSEDKS